MTTSVTVRVPEDASYKAVVVALDAQPNGPSASFRIEVPPGNETVFHAHATRVIEVSEEPIAAVEVNPGAKGAADEPRPISSDETVFEQQLQAKGLMAPRLTPEMIDARIAGEVFHVFPGTTMTVCALTLQNGFVVTGKSAAASPENFDAETGRDLARKNARDKIWELEGYLLREVLAGQSVVLNRFAFALPPSK